jgi:vacuolar-type H+-ATPase subunit E/Vma4
MTFALTPKTLIGISVSMLVLAAVFGVLNNLKVKGLHADVANFTATHEAAEHRRIADEKNLKAREAAAAEATRKFAESESKAAKAEADLGQAQKEKADLQAKLEANEAEIAASQKNVEEAGGKHAGEVPGTASSTEMQAQLDEARRSLDSAETEKVFLSDKLRVAQERVTQLEDEKKRRAAVAGKPGVRGTVLAVNQAYNFVVLNLGGRQGVEPNSEMLVLRDGVLIGKIRISSVEPATAIGDIIGSSLARGVQVQPGDIVIYAGTNS